MKNNLHACRTTERKRYNLFSMENRVPNPQKTTRGKGIETPSGIVPQSLGFERDFKPNNKLKNTQTTTKTTKKIIRN